MKILLITEFFPTGKDLKFSGGVEARTFFVAKGLAQKHEVTVLASRTEKVPKKEKIFGFTIIRVGPERNYTASVGHLVSRILFIKNATEVGKSLNVEIVDGGNYIAHLIARNIGNYKKIPVVAWYPDVWLKNWIKNAGLYGIFGEILESYNLRSRFDAYIAISKETLKKLQRFFKSRVNLIYCGVNREEFKKNEIKFKEPVILCISRLAKYKNIKTLIFAFAHLSTKVRNTNLIIVGQGPEFKNLKALTKSLKIEKRIKFLSNLPRSQLISLYKKSHIFSLPSIVEGFGIATIEAAAAGLPYVNSDIPVQREITKNGKGGYLVDPQNSVAFSDKLYTLIKNQDLYKRKSQEARSLAANYDWDNIVKQTEKVYMSLLKNR